MLNVNLTSHKIQLCQYNCVGQANASMLRLPLVKQTPQNCNFQPLIKYYCTTLFVSFVCSSPFPLLVSHSILGRSHQPSRWRRPRYMEDFHTWRTYKKSACLSTYWYTYSCLHAGRDARLASARALAMSSVGYGFALPCLQLLSALTRRRVAGALLLAAAVVFLINGYRFGWYHKEIKVIFGTSTFNMITDLRIGGQTVHDIKYARLKWRPWVKRKVTVSGGFLIINQCFGNYQDVLILMGITKTIPAARI